MPTAGTVWVFAGAAVALLVVPGPSVFFLVAQSVQSGRRGGMAAMLGVQTGGLVHVLAATLGVSALLASSATLFTGVKLVGAAYLVWLGVQRLRDRTSLARIASAPSPSRSSAGHFRRGFVVNVFNPKAALFFAAVLPQFIDPARGRVWAQTLVLGAVFLALAVVSDGAWVMCAGWVASRIRSPRAQRIERSVSATILIGLGAAAALSRRVASHG